MLAPILLLPKILALADRAGAVILEHYAGEIVAATKADRSPVTEADEAAERVILAGLAELTPDIPVVAEEAVAKGGLPELRSGRFWLVDPLDGTREFLSKNGEFTVNIGLVDDGVPIMGVVTAPAKNLAWWGAAGRAPAAARGATSATSACAPGPRAGWWRWPAGRTAMPTPTPGSRRRASPIRSRPAAP